jgi:RND family efflux transporter MFP subunit
MIPRFLSCLLAGLLAISAAYAQEDAVVVGVDEVVVEQVNETASVIGRFVSRQSGTVATEVEGAVAEIFVEVGDRVQKGDELVRIRADRMELRRDLLAAEVTEAKAQLAAAEADESLRRQELSRLDSLSESAAFSQARYDDTVQQVAMSSAGVAVADAAVLRAEANLALAQDEVENAVIRAPYDGVVVLRHTEVGSYVTSGSDIVDMVNDSEIEIEADVPHDAIGGLDPGVPVRVELGDDDVRTAKVRAVGVGESAQSRTRSVRFTPDWQVIPGTLGDGQTVLIEIPVGEAREAVTVHKDAVNRNAGMAQVFVVVDGKAQARDVVLGEAVGIRFIVLDGLVPGELVVVRGNERLFPGQAVAF